MNAAAAPQVCSWHLGPKKVFKSAKEANECHLEMMLEKVLDEEEICLGQCNKVSKAKDERKQSKRKLLQEEKERKMQESRMHAFIRIAHLA
jgi:hypothetical protein